MRSRLTERVGCRLFSLFFALRLRLIDKEHPEYAKLSRRQKIKVNNDEAGLT